MPLEVIQWESGMSMNAIASAQGIQIRRRYRARYPSEGTGAERAVPRNILEQIIWDKEVEVSQRKARTPLSDVKAAAQGLPRGAARRVPPQRRRPRAHRRGQEGVAQQGPAQGPLGSGQFSLYMSLYDCTYVRCMLHGF